MNRFDRITSILIHLQSKTFISAQEIAERYEISLRTVYRDIRSLEEAGVPIISEPGKGYSIMEGYRLPPVMFSKDEAMALSAGAKVMNSINDEELKKHLDTAFLKIKSVLKSGDKEVIEAVEDNIAILDDPYHRLKQPIPLEKILSSLAEKINLFIEYKSGTKSEVTRREVEPVGVFQTYDNWRMIAYCHLRKDYRDFRLDRIKRIQITSTPFTRKHKDLHHFLKRSKKEYELEEVVFTTCKRSWPYYQNQKHYFGFVKEKIIGDRVEVHFLTPSLWGIARWTMSFADGIEVIKPTALEHKHAYIAEKILKKIKVAQGY